LYPGRSVTGRLVTGRFVTGRYVTGRFVGVPFFRSGMYMIYRTYAMNIFASALKLECKNMDDIHVCFIFTVKWGNIVFGFNIVTSMSKCLSGHISRYNEFISLV
jgi:hypothetical protein